MPHDLHALDIEPKARADLTKPLQDYLATCEEKLGFVPNVLLSYAFDDDKLAHFIAMSDNLLLADSGVSKLEREMIAVVVSSFNHCYYCLAAHGAVVRKRSGDPRLGDKMVMNYRTADLTTKQRAMLDFAWKLTEKPWEVGEADRQALRDAGWTERDIWDIAAVASFFNMSNRLATAVEMRPNDEYHSLSR
jgi:uncharacterized peroxidase-related enzyme